MRSTKSPRSASTCKPTRVARRHPSRVRPNTQHKTSAHPATPHRSIFTALPRHPTTRPSFVSHTNLVKPQYATLTTPSFQPRSAYSHTSVSQDYDPTGRPIHRATTILCVRKKDSVVIIGDGQVSLGPTIVKPNARKVRRIGQGNVIVGFAGSTADAFALVELLEQQLETYPGQLLRAAVETAKGWRTGKYTRHLEAMLIATDENISLCISGNGDVIESHDGLLGIGSGSMYALAAARALIDLDDHDAMAIAKKSMKIAADICVYTNGNFIIDSLKANPAPEELGHSTSLSLGKEDVTPENIKDDNNVPKL